jgi:transposase
MLRMLDRHAVQELLRAGVKPRHVAQQMGVSRRTIERIAREAPVTAADDRAARATRRLGRPQVDAAVHAAVRRLVEEDPALPPGEVWRRLREAGTPLGLSTVYRVLAQARQQIPAELLVRFEGVAGEFAQFDFGQADVRLTSGQRRRIHFAAYRLKWSRWMHVVVVPNERVEALVRSLLASFAAAGGVPLRVVFDNPKTVVLRREEGRPVWNATLAEVVLDYGFSIELCTPRAPEQKGAVENLVGFVKRAFFRARRFVDLDDDLPQQLTVWLTEVNEVRPNRATGEPPAARLRLEQARLEQARLKPLVTAPADYGLKVPVTVGPTAMVHYQGVRYAMPAAACGLPATLHLYPDRVRIVCAGGRHEAVHPRFPLVGTVSYLTGQRAQQLAAVYGERKRLYFMRERLLELGPVGEAYVTELVHQRPHTWKGDVERLFNALEVLGEARFRAVLQRALMQRLLGAEYVERLAEQLREEWTGEVAS